MNKDARTKAASSRPSAGRKTAAEGSKRSAKAAATSARRTWFVLAGLAGGMAFTGALLKALAPPPLTPDVSTSLFAVSQEQRIERIFDTPVAVTPGRWHSIYVHQSLTPSGNAESLGDGAGGLRDHFLIGNGDPLADGALQKGARWNQQLSAGAVRGFDINRDCLSICLVGNFNQAGPTAAQQRQLVELICALQKQQNIPSEQVFLGLDVARTSAAGVGSRFPSSEIRAKLGQ